jgi:hypothetical protein
MSSAVLLMPSACRHELQCSGCFQAADGARLRDVYEPIGADNYAVKPMDMPPALYAADHADVRAVDLSGNVADEVLSESKGVGQFSFDLMHFHCTSPLRINSPREQSTPACGHTASKMRVKMAPGKYGIGGISSFSFMNAVTTGCAA